MCLSSYIIIPGAYSVASYLFSVGMAWGGDWELFSVSNHPAGAFYNTQIDISNFLVPVDVSVSLIFEFLGHCH